LKNASRRHHPPSSGSKGGGGFQQSIVFLKKKAAQAIMMQTHIRGFLARRWFAKQVDQLRLEQAQRREQIRLEQAQNEQQRKQHALVSRVQALVRCFLQRKLYIHLVRQSRVVIQLQTFVRSLLQRHRWKSYQKLEFQLAQIQRQEQAALDAIEKDKRTRIQELDQTLEDFQRQQHKLTRKSVKLDETTQNQEDLKVQVRRDNKQLRTKIDRFLVQRREFKFENQQLHQTIHLVNDTYEPQLQEKIVQLERSIQKAEVALRQYQTAETKLQTKLDRVEELVLAEHCCQGIYQRFADRIVQNIYDRCPEDDRLLRAPCMALSHAQEGEDDDDDSVSPRVTDLEQRLQQVQRETRNDLQSMEEWKQDQMQQALQEQQRELIQEATRLLTSTAMVQTAYRQLQAQEEESTDQLEAVLRACQKKQRKLTKVQARAAEEHQHSQRAAECIFKILDKIETQYEGDNRDKLMKKLRRTLQKSLPSVQE